MASIAHAVKPQLAKKGAFGLDMKGVNRALSPASKKHSMVETVIKSAVFSPGREKA